jgi:hypothetical protein
MRSLLSIWAEESDEVVDLADLVKGKTGHQSTSHANLNPALCIHHRLLTMKANVSCTRRGRRTTLDAVGAADAAEALPLPESKCRSTPGGVQGPAGKTLFHQWMT